MYVILLYKRNETQQQAFTGCQLLPGGGKVKLKDATIPHNRGTAFLLHVQLP